MRDGASFNWLLTALHVKLYNLPTVCHITILMRSFVDLIKLPNCSMELQIGSIVATFNVVLTPTMI